jgi:hypothetical protein
MQSLERAPNPRGSVCHQSDPPRHKTARLEAILVPRDITLRNLHRTLQTVKGWTDSHLHQFIFRRLSLSDLRSRVGSKVADENRTKLGELIETAGAKLLYEYDFGDGWQHGLLVEEVLLGDESFQQICGPVNDVVHRKTVGDRKDLQNCSKALQDASDPSHEEVCAWLGDFVPESFSLDEANRRLRRRRRR